MTISRALAGTSIAVSAALLALAAPSIASAHVTVDGTSTAPGTASTLSFTIEHGCDGSPTTGVAIDIPEGVSAVTPVANAGWQVAFDLAGPERRMTYLATTPLPSAVHDTLSFDVTLADDLADGTALVFPVTQTCETGALAWDATEADADHPAPQLIVAVPAPEEAPAATTGSDDRIAVAALVAALAATALATIALRRQRATR